MIQHRALASLLGQTKLILAHQREKELLKGERFNIFSILGIENSENSTHSAFLSELLNPEGSHLKGSIFLKLFLDIVEHRPTIDIHTTSVKVEKHLGFRDDIAGTGGRVDIYIRDASNRTICIENKIYAGDQDKQIIRYHNHNTSQNTVYYLTLHGSLPDVASRGELEPGLHFHLISYKREVIDWLRLCMKEATDAPILRETLRQYIILLQKLTATMDGKESQALTDLILQHYEEARYISRQFEEAKNALTESVRQGVISALEPLLADDYVLYPGSITSKMYSQIWVSIKGYGKAPLLFGIESFSGAGNWGGGIWCGIFNKGAGGSAFAKINGNIPHSVNWINMFHPEPLDGLDIHLGNPDTIKKIHSDASYKARFIDHIAVEANKYIRLQTPALKTFLSTNA